MTKPNNLTLALAVGSLFTAGFAAAVESSIPTGAQRLPGITVSAEKAIEPKTSDGSILGEVGTYGQPGWTKHRRFSTTRVYVQRDPWEVGFEQWWRGRAIDSSNPQHRFIEEIEIGLPFRMQLDLYYDWIHKNGSTDFEDFAVELRYSLADWGVIPLNPTLYAEYKWGNEGVSEDVLELKLLLGDNIGEKLSYGINFIWEQELAGEETTEYQGTAGLSYDISDAISAGLELKYVRETVKGGRNDPEHKFLIGPSLQFRPTHNTHLDLVSLFGVTEDAPDVEAYVIFGIDFDFGKSSSGGKIRQPVSGAHN